MSLNKVTYVDGVTVIHADNLNEIQDNIIASESALDTKAEVDGNYPNMTVGNAEQLVATVGIEDKVPYLFRTSGGAADIGDRETDTVVGGSVAWNQISNKTGVPATATVSDVTFTNNGDGTIAVSGTASAAVTQRISGYFTLQQNHVYYAPPGKNIKVYDGYTVDGYSIFKFGRASATGAIYASIDSGKVVSETIYSMAIDLTQMFGSTIADYIYTLESGTAGAGVAWLKKYCPKMFSTYQAYNAGELLSVKTTAHEMVGFNAWDEVTESGYINVTTGADTADANYLRAKNYNPCLPSTNYYCACSASMSSIAMCWYDADKNYIGYTATASAKNKTFESPANARYFRLYFSKAYYSNDICINLSWDGERDGEYEPYVKHTYPLDSDLELRGIPKLDAGNNLYYDGDTYESDGTVTRRYGIVDLGELSWVSENDVVPGQFRAPAGTDTIGALFHGGLMCAKYVGNTTASYNTLPDKQISVTNSQASPILRIHDTAYDGQTGSAFEAAMSGVYLVYELATHTTESADPYQNPQIVDDFGTESYADSRTVPVPVGHTTTYSPNLRAKLEMAPDSPADGDGDYIVRQTSGENKYVKLVKELPTLPTTDGSYTLTCTVASGTPTLSWVANE